MPGDPPLRERKRQATRERLLSTALELFGRRGYDATTMDDIAAGADVSRATAFNYFPKKEEFLHAWVDQRRHAVRALLAREQDDVDTITRIEHAFRTLGDRLEADPDTNRALIHAWVRAGVSLQPGASTTADIFAETIRHGQARGDLRSDVDATAIGRVLLDAYTGALMRWASADPVPLKEQLTAAVTLLSRALTRP